MGNFLIRPLLYLISVNPDHDVVMVAHDGVGTKIDRENGTQQLDAIDDPLAAVLEVKACQRIRPAQERTPDTSGDAVVIRCVIDGDLAVSWFWHMSSLDK